MAPGSFSMLGRGRPWPEHRASDGACAGSSHECTERANLCAFVDCPIHGGAEDRTRRTASDWIARRPDDRAVAKSGRTSSASSAQPGWNKPSSPRAGEVFAETSVSIRVLEGAVVATSLAFVRTHMDHACRCSTPLTRLRLTTLSNELGCRGYQPFLTHRGELRHGDRNRQEASAG